MYSYHYTHWLQFPVFCLTILDMFIGLYFSLTFESFVTYALSNALFCLYFIPLIIIVVFFLEVNYYHQPRTVENIDIPFFIINTMFHIPIIIIKLLLIFIYIPDISHSLGILWLLISLPILVRHGVIFIAIYWSLIPLIKVIIFLVFPKYNFRQRTLLSYYRMTYADLKPIYKISVLRRQKIYENTIANFLRRNELHGNNEVDMMYISQDVNRKGNYCNICLEILKVHKMQIVNLNCGHIFHSSCIQLWLLLNHFECLKCQKSINYDQEKESKTWISKFHYHQIVISLKIMKYCFLGNSNSILYSYRNPILYFYLITSFIACIPLPFISYFTQNKFTFVLANSLILLILLKIMIHSFATILTIAPVFHDRNHFHFNDYWKEENQKNLTTKDHLIFNISYRGFLIVEFVLIGLAFYLIPTDATQLYIFDYIFLIAAGYLAFIDIVAQLALLQIISLLLNVLYDVLVVFPVVLVYMLHQRKNISELWLRI